MLMTRTTISQPTGKDVGKLMITVIITIMSMTRATQMTTKTKMTTSNGIMVRMMLAKIGLTMR